MDVYKETKKLLNDVSILNGLIDEEMLKIPAVRDMMAENYEKFDKRFIEAVGTNCEYFNKDRKKESRLFDSKLFFLLYLIEKSKLSKDDAVYMLEAFGDVEDIAFGDLCCLFASDERYVFSIEELKKGLEEGLNINEAIGCLGFSRADSAANIKYLVRYLDFFRMKSRSKSFEVAAFLRALKTPGKPIDPDLVLYAKDPEELKKVAPVICTTQEVHEAALNEKGMKPAGAAHYFAYMPGGDPDNVVYKCFSPDDGEMMTSESQFNAQRWVMDKNNRASAGNRRRVVKTYSK